MLNIDWTPALATRVAALMHITTANDIAKIDHVVTFYQNVFFSGQTSPGFAVGTYDLQRSSYLFHRGVGQGWNGMGGKERKGWEKIW